MTIPNSQYKVSYEGGGATGTIYNIPFPWDAAASLKVRTISSAGVVAAKTEGSSNDYSLTGVLTNGTQTVYTHAAAEFGWIKWNAAATESTDTIEIYREEPTTVTTDYVDTGAFGTVTQFERDADRIAMALSRTCNRSETDPLVYDAKSRYIKDLGNPLRGDDALNDTILNTMSAVTPALEIPGSASANKFITPTGYASGSGSGSVAWSTPNHMPSVSGVNVRYPLVSTSSSEYEWQAFNWIPPAPDDGFGYFLAVNQAGTMSWAKVYEVPMSTAGSNNDVVELTSARVIGWKTLTESPYASTKNQKTGRFVIYNSGVAWGPRFTYGTHSISDVTGVTENADTYAQGIHGDTGVQTFQFNHGMKNDSNADVAPDRVFLTIGTEKLDATGGSGGDDAIPVYVAMLDHASASPAGITSTQVNGKVQYLNVNDELSESYANPTGSGKRNLVIPDDESHDIQIHWLAMKD